MTYFVAYFRRRGVSTLMHWTRVLLRWVFCLGQPHPDGSLLTQVRYTHSDERIAIWEYTVVLVS